MGHDIIVSHNKKIPPCQLKIKAYEFMQRAFQISNLDFNYIEELSSKDFRNVHFSCLWLIK